MDGGCSACAPTMQQIASQQLLQSKVNSNDSVPFCCYSFGRDGFGAVVILATSLNQHDCQITVYTNELFARCTLHEFAFIIQPNNRTHLAAAMSSEIHQVSITCVTYYNELEFAFTIGCTKDKT